MQLSAVDRRQCKGRASNCWYCPQTTKLVTSAQGSRVIKLDFTLVCEVGVHVTQVSDTKKAVYHLTLSTYCTAGCLVRTEDVHCVYVSVACITLYIGFQTQTATMAALLMARQ